jgi:hypothetical protein
MSAQKKKNQTIEELTERYQTLDKKKTTAEANLKTTQDQLYEFKKEAMEKYGTDDLDNLKDMLEKMENENEEKRAAYQESLNTIEKNLKEIEEKYKNAD